MAIWVLDPLGLEAIFSPISRIAATLIPVRAYTKGYAICDISAALIQPTEASTCISTRLPWSCQIISFSRLYIFTIPIPCVLHKYSFSLCGYVLDVAFEPEETAATGR